MLVFQFGVVICFWESLASIDLTDLPCWVLLGDFNCISNAQDKLSDPFFFSFLCSTVQSVFVRILLSDLGFIGPRDTRCNNLRGNARILVRLVRAFANCKWLDLFGYSVVKHLPATCFDHCSILLSMVGRDKPSSFLFKFTVLGPSMVRLGIIYYP